MVKSPRRPFVVLFLSVVYSKRNNAAIWWTVLAQHDFPVRLLIALSLARCRESVTVNDQLSRLLWDCAVPVDPHLSLTMPHILIGSGLTLGNNAR